MVGRYAEADSRQGGRSGSNQRWGNKRELFCINSFLLISLNDQQKGERSFEQKN